ncbi:MAG: ABC transporter permease [Eubacteriales bacterium]|jgi:ABC-type uncharacterized transport system permease subunit|nr:ABC transporter permease [Eubacteriales bacterium]
MTVSENNRKARGPLLRMVKRPRLQIEKLFFFYAIAILTSIAVGGIFMAFMGVNPFRFYAVIISGCFRSKLAMVSLVRIIVPLLITTLGVSLAFKMKFWNIGAEGQFIMGAIGAAFIALNFGGTLPHWLTMLLMAAAGIVFGGVWGFIAAFCKCRFDTNETLLTLMLNYIALYIIQYLRDGPWRDPAAGGFPKIAKFPENAWVDKLWGFDVSWIIALALVVVVYIYLKYTKQGFEIAVVGDSMDTARYAGMNNGRIIMRTMFLSAAICGLGGMLQVAGDATSHTLSMGIASGVGFTAIIVAWLAKLNPFGIAAVSVLFGMLEKGSGVAESTFGISSSVSDILQGIILFVILGADFFVRYKPVVRRRERGVK